MTDILHFSHAADRTMLTQCKNKIFWPGIAKTLQDRYADCEKCQQHKASQATPHTTVSGEDLFSNFMPGQRIQIDYAQQGNNNYLMIVDCISGYMQAYKTPRKSTEDAIKSLRSWASKWVCPMKSRVTTALRSKKNGQNHWKNWASEYCIPQHTTASQWAW